MRIGRLPRRRSWTQRTVLASIGTLVFAISGVAAGLAGYLSAATDAGVRTTLEAAVAGDAAVEVAIHGGGDQTAAHTAITDHLDRLLTGVPYRLQRHAVGPPPGDAVRTRYRLVIDTRRLDRAGAETLMAAVTRLDGRLSGDARLAGARVDIDDKLSPALRETRDYLHAARSVAIVPLVLLGVACVIALILAAVLLTTTRTAETVLLRARGATSGLLARWAAREAVPVALLPAAAGGLAAWLLLRSRSEVGELLSPTVLLAGALAAALLAMLILIVTSANSTREGVHPTVRRQPALRAGTIPLVVVVAAVSLWQLRRYGAPSVTDAAGMSRTDPLAVAAPAATLLAAGMLTTMLVAVLARAAGRLVARLRGVNAVFAVRHAARRPAAYTLPVVLLVIAAGGGTLTAGVAATWTGLQADAAAQRTGAGLQVVLRDGSPSVLTPESEGIDLLSYRAVPGVERVRPGVSIPGAVTADGTLELMAGPFEAGRLGAAPAPAGVELAARSRWVEVELDVAVGGALDEERFALEGIDATGYRRPPPAPVHTQLWVADADGMVTVLAPDPLAAPADGRHSVHRARSELPTGVPPWTVIGLSLQVSPPRPDRFVFAPWIYDYDISVTGLRTDSGRVAFDDQAWSVARLDSDVQLSFRAEPATDGVTAEPHVSGVGLRVESGGLAWSGQVSTRMVPGDRATHPVSVAATAAALDRFGLSVGDQVSLRVLGSDLPVKIVESVPSVPGTTATDVMVADLGELTASMLARGGGLPTINRIWVDAAAEALADGTAARGVADLAGPQARVLDRTALERELRTNAFAGLSVTTFWVTAVALVLLAVVGLAAAVAALARQHGSEIAVLRSVGVSAGQQGAMRVVEQVFVAVPAVGLGAAAGWLLMARTAGLLAGAATPIPLENLRPVVRLSAGPWAGLLLTLVLLCLLVAAAHGVQVRRQAARLHTADEVG